VVALGPTGKAPVGESHWSDSPAGSAYQATKRAAHEVARKIARAKKAPLCIALPVTIYGPDDPSLIGVTHRAFARGLLRVGVFPDRELSMVHVEDCAEGLLRIAERGEDGEEYILCERVATIREWFDLLGRASRRRAPALYLPDWLVQRAVPLVAPAAPLAGFAPAVVVEGLAMADRWAFSGEKAKRALGWSPRPFEEGLRETMAWYSSRGA
jgi:dihydroflavonol-4-reductase